jgi:hypothetical protein
MVEVRYNLFIKKLLSPFEYKEKLAYFNHLSGWNIAKTKHM